MIRRSLTALIALVVLASSLGGLASVAHAQQDTAPPETPPAGFINPADQFAPTINCSGNNCDVTPSAASSAAVPGTADPSAQKTTTPPKDSSAATDDTSYGFVMQKLMGLFAWLLGVAALTLDNAVYYTVVRMGSIVGGADGLAAIGTAWRILRDIGNIVLIFGFVAIGVSIILDTKWYGGGTKMLPTLLIAAVFLNFSLFVSEAVIDVGNLFATQFYTQINGGTLTKPLDYSQTNVINEGISNKIMSQLGLASLYGDAVTNPDLLKTGHSWLIGFMGILLFLIAAFVMFSLAFILIARFVVLVFLMIIAPIGFAGLAIPQLEGTANQWWSALFEQTVTAPVLLLMLYVALAVITDAKFLTNFGVGGSNSAASNTALGYWTSWAAGSSTGVGGLASAILSFLVAMGLLLMVTVLSKRLSAFGADWAKRSAGTIVGGFAGYGVLGGASLFARGTAGLGGRALNSKSIQARAAEGGAKGLAFKALAFTGRNLENRKFDLRNSKLAQKAGGAIVSGLTSGQLAGSGFEQVRLGKGATVSAKQAVENVREAYKKYTPLHGFEGTWWRDQQREYEQAAKDLERKKNLDPASPEFTRTLKKSSADELAELRGIRKGLANFVEALSPAKYGELQKNSKLLQSEKDNIKRTWEAQFDTPAGAKATLARFNTTEIAGLDGKTLTKEHVALELGTPELEAVRRKGELTIAQRHDIYDHFMHDPAKYADFNDYLAADTTGAREKYWKV